MYVPQCCDPPPRRPVKAYYSAVSLLPELPGPTTEGELGLGALFGGYPVKEACWGLLPNRAAFAAENCYYSILVPNHIAKGSVLSKKAIPL